MFVGGLFVLLESNVWQRKFLINNSSVALALIPVFIIARTITVHLASMVDTDDILQITLTVSFLGTQLLTPWSHQMSPYTPSSPIGRDAFPDIHYPVRLFSSTFILMFS